MDMVDRYHLIDVGFRLKRTLQRKYPDVLMYTGLTYENPPRITIHVSRNIEVPTTFQGYEIHCSVHEETDDGSKSSL